MEKKLSTAEVKGLRLIGKTALWFVRLLIVGMWYGAYGEAYVVAFRWGFAHPGMTALGFCTAVAVALAGLWFVLVSKK